MPILLPQSGPHQRPLRAVYCVTGFFSRVLWLRDQGVYFRWASGEIPAAATPGFQRLLTSADRALTGKVIPCVG
jgi:hypothetical protein